MAIEGYPWDGTGLPYELTHRMMQPQRINLASKTYAVGTYYIPLCGPMMRQMTLHYEKVSGGTIAVDLEAYGGTNAGTDTSGWWGVATLAADTPTVYYPGNHGTAIAGATPVDPAQAFRLKVTITGSAVVANINAYVEPWQ